MSGDRERGTVVLGEGIAATLRIGTLVSTGLVALGYGSALLNDDPGPGRTPLFEMLGAGGAWMAIGAGLLGLTLLPVAMLVVAAVGFHLRRERRMRLAAALVAALLLATLFVAIGLAQRG